MEKGRVRVHWQIPEKGQGRLGAVAPAPRAGYWREAVLAPGTELRLETCLILPAGRGVLLPVQMTGVP